MGLLVVRARGDTQIRISKVMGAMEKKLEHFLSLTRFNGIYLFSNAYRISRSKPKMNHNYY